MSFTSLYIQNESLFIPSIGRMVKQAVVMLPGAGCAWAKKSGGCHMCGFSGATRKYSRGIHLPLALFKLLISRAKNLLSTSDVVAVYNGGSFFNPDELSEALPEWLCGNIAKLADVKELFVESRPEYIQEEQIRSLVSILGGKTLKVGIGLECSTDTIRQHCVHKGFSKAQYKRAVDILKVNGASVLTYVLLKPPFLTEKESIDEAVATIEYAFASGSTEVALESAFVQPNTFVSKLYEAGEFQPPWLWSIIEVLQKVAGFHRTRLGGFLDEPIPIAVPHNCSNCNSHVLYSLQSYRETLSVDNFASLDCECKGDWEREIKVSNLLSIPERLAKSVA